jgi:hypothetical protein
MKRWKTSLLMPARRVPEVARCLAARAEDIACKYQQAHSQDFEIEIVQVVRRPRSVLVAVESQQDIAVNLVSDAIMACLPDDCHDVKVPYWS